MIGTVFPGLLPAKPWHALQTIAFCAPDESSGPAAVLNGSHIKAATIRTNAISWQFHIVYPFD
jgi:hypothetical protein